MSTVASLRKLADELEEVEAQIEESQARRAEVIAAIAQLSNNGAVVVAPKSGKRGRPAKVATEKSGAAPKRGRGRPPGVGNKKATKGKKPGRPAKKVAAKKSAKAKEAADRKPRSNSLWAVVQKVLKTHKSGMTLDKLAGAVYDAGYKSKSGNFENMLYQTLQKKVNEADAGLVREEDKYRLSEAA
jgi:hypothetical protein